MGVRKNSVTDTKKCKVNAEKIKNLRPTKHECASIPCQYNVKK